MDTELKNKIKQYIGNLSYFDAKENMYTDKNEYAMVVNASVNRERNDSIEEALGRSGIVGVAWQTGGASGGNCYGGEAEAYTVEEPNIREFYLLDDIFSDLFPDLKYMEYRKIMQMTPIHHKTTGNYEYYGNRTDYYVKYIKVDELLNAFDELGLSINEEHLNTLNKTLEDKKTTKIKPKR
jgi:hypothetical protein